MRGFRRKLSKAKPAGLCDAPGMWERRRVVEGGWSGVAVAWRYPEEAVPSLVKKGLGIKSCEFHRSQN
jgi:hypothetical protein